MKRPLANMGMNIVANLISAALIYLFGVYLGIFPTRGDTIALPVFGVATGLWLVSYLLIISERKIFRQVFFLTSCVLMLMIPLYPIFKGLSEKDYETFGAGCAWFIAVLLYLIYTYRQVDIDVTIYSPRIIRNGDTTTWMSGQAARDGLEQGGWFVGPFLNSATDALRATSAVEVNWGIYATGESLAEAVIATPRTTMCLLVSGKIQVKVQADIIHLNQPGAYVLCAPGVNCSWNALKDSVILTIRWPLLTLPPAIPVTSPRGPETA